MTGGLARVLELLRDTADRPLSGESLSNRLEVSRAQVWKYVETLRRRGYQIEAERGEGYRLAGIPDRLYPEELQTGLQTRWIAREIEYLDSIDSTNRRAYERAVDGASAGTTIVAEAQTAGRGRLGRSFFSPAYANLYTSIVLRPKMTTATAPTLILCAAVAVADAVAETLDDSSDVEIKWPNDVLVGGLKTSGILMEMSAEATRVAFAILGIGVNLNVPRESFPDEFRQLATSLSSHCGRTIDRSDFARCLYQHLETALEPSIEGDFDAIRPRFESYFRMSGRPVRVLEMNGTEIAGTAAGIDGDGALLLELSSGEVRRVIAGDVTIAKENLAS